MSPQVRLDVVDTNPDARRLCERKGFQAIRHVKYGVLTAWMGFTGSTTLVKDVTKPLSV